MVGGPATAGLAGRSRSQQSDPRRAALAAGNPGQVVLVGGSRNYLGMADGRSIGQEVRECLMTGLGFIAGHSVFAGDEVEVGCPADAKALSRPPAHHRGSVVVCPTCMTALDTRKAVK